MPSIPHFVERHGLIVIIAIGESLVAIGLGTRGTRLGAGVIVAAVPSLVAAVWVALHAYELIWWREARARADASTARSCLGALTTYRCAAGSSPVAPVLYLRLLVLRQHPYGCGRRALLRAARVRRSTQ